MITRLTPESQHLGPAMYPERSQPTARFTDNRHGLTFPLSRYGQAFVDFAARSQYPVLDIGAAYGVTTLPAIDAGATVIANDLSESQLEILATRVAPGPRRRLQIRPGRFPDELDFPPSSLGGVHASHVLHFLSPNQLQAGCDKLFRWLAEGGKAFVVCFSPYHRFMERYISTYETRLERGDEWPGFVADSTTYALEKGILPNQVHLMDPTILRREFERAGFTIEKSEFLGCTADLEPRHFFHLMGESGWG